MTEESKNRLPTSLMILLHEDKAPTLLLIRTDSLKPVLNNWPDLYGHWKETCHSLCSSLHLDTFRVKVKYKETWPLHVWVFSFSPTMMHHRNGKHKHYNHLQQIQHFVFFFSFISSFLPSSSSFFFGGWQRTKVVCFHLRRRFPSGITLLMETHLG